MLNNMKKCGFIDSDKKTTGGIPILEWKCYCDTTACKEIQNRKINWKKTFGECMDENDQ